MATTEVLCPHCGEPAGDRAAFCPSCGQSLLGRRAAPTGAPIELGGRSYVLAGFGVRLGAFVIDIVFAWVLAFAIDIALRAAWGGGLDPLQQNPAPGAILVAQAAVLSALQWLEEAAGVTPGKKMLGIRSIRGDGARPGPVHGFARLQGRLFSTMAFLLGYLWAAWDRENQTWHDKIANTRVVRVTEGFAFRGSDEFATREDPFAGRPLATGKGAWVWAIIGAPLLFVGVAASAISSGIDPESFAVAQGFEAQHPLPSQTQLAFEPRVTPRPDACTGEGPRVCLVPIGHPPTIPLEGLAAYYTSTFGLDIEVLAPLGLNGELYRGEFINRNRDQLDGDGLIDLMERTYPHLVADPDASVIGVTWHDMYGGGRPEWIFALSRRSDTDFAVVSSARMDDAAFGWPADPALLNERLQRMTTKNIGVMHYGLPLSADPTSAMYCCILSVGDLDWMKPELLLNDGPAARAPQAADSARGPANRTALAILEAASSAPGGLFATELASQAPRLDGGLDPAQIALSIDDFAAGTARIRGEGYLYAPAADGAYLRRFDGVLPVINGTHLLTLEARVHVFSNESVAKATLERSSELLPWISDALAAEGIGQTQDAGGVESYDLQTFGAFSHHATIRVFDAPGGLNHPTGPRLNVLFQSERVGPVVVTLAAIGPDANAGERVLEGYMRIMTDRLQ